MVPVGVAVQHHEPESATQVHLDPEGRTLGF